MTATDKMHKQFGKGKQIPILYLAPWVDFGGSDKGTIDWFRWLDRDRFVPSLITTQPSRNRRLREIRPFAREIWPLPELMRGPEFPGFILDFLHTRDVRLLHIMNSRLGFDLLPDLASLDHPPAVVVQLHVEESSRSGYVRYVATRYGNLVDAFSVTSRHLARAVEGYDVPASKIHVIHTGVDAEREFNPERVRPLRAHRDPGSFHILFPGRLVDQKDPLLMVDVVGEVVARHKQVRVDVVGDGPLESAVRGRVRELCIDRFVRFHPPTAELATWLRSTDALLMTSVFEGVPYIVYEALAMRVPVVAPALPGNVELMGETGGLLIEPRDDLAGYTEAICRLIEDQALYAQLSAAGRARMLDSFSLRGMAARHEAVYDLLNAGRELRSPHFDPIDPPAPLRLSQRPMRGRPLVSIVTPCFNHGHYLRQFIDGIRAQDYPSIEVIIVDDASTDSGTVATLNALEHDSDITVLRRDRNSGPSAARNRAVSAARGRYILPVDADNILLPGAVSGLVKQLQAASERVGFIYPSFQYFGTRDYMFRPPAYNMFALLSENYVDTCSLVDRAIFDAGFRYGEDIKLGHEDWDLALALAARDVIGEPSREPVMLYRKQGFTRSDAVEYLRLPFWQEIQGRHPELFGTPADVGAWGRYRGPAVRIKARWSPALSVIAAEPFDFACQDGIGLLAGLRRQTCQDFELLAECPRLPPRNVGGVRRIALGLPESKADRIQEALDMSRGRFLLISSDPSELLADATTVEKLLRGFVTDPELGAVAFADVSSSERHPFALIDRIDTSQVAHGVAWRRELHGELPKPVLVDEGCEVESLATAILLSGTPMHWRHFPATTNPNPPNGFTRPIVLDGRNTAVVGPSRKLERTERLRATPAIPAIPEDQVRRWTLLPTWMPTETLPLARHVELGGPRRVITNRRESPPGYQLECDLGAIRRFSPPGSVRLLRRNGSLITVPRGSERLEGDEELGHLEEAPLPLLVAIERAVLWDGSETLVAATERDNVRPNASELTHLGFIESFPIEPLHAPPRVAGFGRPVLVRWIDRGRRCHRYGVVIPPAEMPAEREFSAELGMLRTARESDAIPVFVDGTGRLSSDRYDPGEPSPQLPQVVRWSAAPLAWRGFGRRGGRARSIARRTLDSARVSALRAIREGTPTTARHLIGYLSSDPGPGRAPLFAGTHPVMRDQFVTHHRMEATDMGYVGVTSLGYIDARAPLTGTLGGGRTAIPWASRFGLVARR